LSEWGNNTTDKHAISGTFCTSIALITGGCLVDCIQGKPSSKLKPSKQKSYL